MVLSQDQLGLKTGMLFSVPIPADKAADQATIKKGIAQALSEADEQKVAGAQITPFLLKRVNELTGGESAASNVELIKNNAVLGGKIAVALSNLITGQKPFPSKKISIIGGAAVDILSYGSKQSVDKEDMIGKITMTAGGSTRNTAECLGRLGVGSDILFVSGIGNDSKNIIIR
jgi:hypothetical protein